jgi:hypothetical protein
MMLYFIDYHLFVKFSNRKMDSWTVWTVSFFDVFNLFIIYITIYILITYILFRRRKGVFKTNCPTVQTVLLPYVYYVGLSSTRPSSVHSSSLFMKAKVSSLPITFPYLKITVGY